jgi:predicted ATPase
VEAWLSSIVRPTQVAASRVPGTSLAILRFREPTVAADWVRPANVGFGLSYALPILVAGLTVAPGSMFLIENPEAHLHPAGQSRMGQFLARLAAAGVQVVVETHSDHLLNGMRKSIARQELSAAAFLVHFFGPEGISTLEARETGGLNDWPPSFFDQLEVDLTDISRAGSGS